MKVFQERFGTVLPVFGMVHLAPLPGSPRYGGDINAVLERARADAVALKEAGVDALIMENFNDEPFFKTEVDPETVSAMTYASVAVKEASGLPLGMNVLRNAWRAAIGISSVVGAAFMRINVLTDAVLTDQGIIEGCAAELLRVRRALGAEEVLVFADIESKHAAPVVHRPTWAVAQDMVERGGADAILVSGETSEDPPKRSQFDAIREAVGKDVPVVAGSGIGIETIDVLKYADGTIFGFGSKPNLKDPVDPEMAGAFMDAVRELRRSKQ